MAAVESVVKKRFFPRVARTTASNPGSKLRHSDEIIGSGVGGMAATGVHGQLFRVPFGDLDGVDVNDRDLDVRAMERYHLHPLIFFSYMCLCPTDRFVNEGQIPPSSDHPRNLHRDRQCGIQRDPLASIC